MMVSLMAPDPESSFELVLRYQSGDQEALGRLLERYSPRLRRWAHGRLPTWARGAEDTMDLVQDTMLQVVKKLDGFEPRHEGAFLGYVRQTLLNKIIDRVRAANRRGPVEPLDTARPAEEPSPHDYMVATELWERYEAAMQLLKPSDREAIIARVEFSLPWAEVAAALGKPTVPAAQMAVSRALTRLARHMSHLGGDDNG